MQKAKKRVKYTDNGKNLKKLGDKNYIFFEQTIKNGVFRQFFCVCRQKGYRERKSFRALLQKCRQRGKEQFVTAWSRRTYCFKRATN